MACSLAVEKAAALNEALPIFYSIDCVLSGSMHNRGFK